MNTEEQKLQMSLESLKIQRQAFTLQKVSMVISIVLISLIFHTKIKDSKMEKRLAALED
jgi:hypothetical protein